MILFIILLNFSCEARSKFLDVCFATPSPVKMVPALGGYRRFEDGIVPELVKKRRPTWAALFLKS